MERWLVVRTDGAARGNPGPAGAGWVVETIDGEIVDDGCAYLGIRTNNQAEYEALLLALEAIKPDTSTHLEVYSDSELMVRQLNGQYRVKNDALRQRFMRVVAALGCAGGARVAYVPRDENRAADALANQAIDAWGPVEEAGGGLEKNA